jgi:hypothetical protein
MRVRGEILMTMWPENTDTVPALENKKRLNNGWDMYKMDKHRQRQSNSSK